MHSTTFAGDFRTRTIGGESASTCNPELMSRYQFLLEDRRLQWMTYHRLEKVLGSGGQGVVFFSTRLGSDGFALPVAMKVFSPERFGTQAAYDEAMLRIGLVASQVARIQHDGVLNVHDFIDRNRVRIMIMEWIDGYDLRELLRLERLVMLRSNLTQRRWDYINNVVITAGPVHARFKAGVAVAIVRDCLVALAALHRENIVHGDIKPSNIMIKRTGYAKLIDIGSAFQMGQQPPIFTVTPAYAAPEVLENAPVSPRSDLASLGYVLVELLSGRPCFVETDSYRELLEQKRSLPQRLHEILPPEVSCNDLLMSFCRGLISPDPSRRFPSAEAAELLHEGAASFHRQLVLSDLASEYDHDIRVWIEELKRIDIEAS
ncbi:MAG: serine/threonine protein kinase [Planctomycetes bacterium]|nr:serine/threonine protein kinase [Planctomycetota bacterium]